MLVVIGAIVAFFVSKHKNDAKTKGGGIIVEGTTTKFKIKECLLPLISDEILENEVIKKYSDTYETIVNKNITTRNESVVNDNFKVISRAMSLYNDFRKLYNDETMQRKVEALRNLYFKITGLDHILNTKEYIRKINWVSVDKTIKEKIDEFIENFDSMIGDYEHKDDILKLANNISENGSVNGSWNEFKEMLNEYVDRATEQIQTNILKNIKSTEIPEAFRHEYFGIIGYGAEQNPIKAYTNDVKTMFVKHKREIGISFINNGFVCQSPENGIEHLVPTDASISTIFKSDSSMRDWYTKNTFIGKVSTKTDIAGYPNRDYEHADVVAASIINAYIQSIIILYVHSGGNDKNKLFRVLLATRLNMIFINILANVTEPKTYNGQVSNSFFIEES